MYGYRPSCLSVSVARSAKLEFIFPRTNRIHHVLSLVHRIFTIFHIWFSQNQMFQYPLLISTATHLPTIKLVHEWWGVSGYVNPGISFSPKARLEWLTRLEIKVWGPSWWGHKPLHFICWLPLYRPGSEAEARDNVSVLRYRTPFEYAGFN